MSDFFGHHSVVQKSFARAHFGTIFNEKAALDECLFRYFSWKEDEALGSSDIVFGNTNCFLKPNYIKAQAKPQSLFIGGSPAGPDCVFV